MPIVNEAFKILLHNFLEVIDEVDALIISDDEGLIIAGEKRKNIDLELISFLTAIVNPILERMRKEFAFKKFGTASFDTDDYRLLFISVTESFTLSLVLDNMGSIDKISPYAYFLAEKSAQILTAEEDDNLQLIVPNFEIEKKSSVRLKNQIYQMRLDSGGQYRFKFIIIGEHEVGKTSLVRRFVDKKFSKDYRATIGLNILTHSFDLFGNGISLSLWDIGAQKYFKRFRKTYYLGAQAAFIVFDLTNRGSFENVKIWYDELNEFIGENKDLPLVLVGNKSDLKEQRKVKFQEGTELTVELSKKGLTHVSFIETSALTGENVEDAFSLIAYHYIMKSKEREEESLKEDLLNELNEILALKDSFTLTFLNETPYWSPGLQILNEISQLGECEMLKDEKEEKICVYPNGLTLKSFLYDKVDVKDADGVFCIFDARQKEHVEPKWKEIVVEMMNKIEENKVVLIGVRISEEIDWSLLMEEFDINELLEKKMVSLLFFKLGEEYRLEIYDQLKVMFSTIKNIS